MNVQLPGAADRRPDLLNPSPPSPTHHSRSRSHSRSHSHSYSYSYSHSYSYSYSPPAQAGPDLVMGDAALEPEIGLRAEPYPIGARSDLRQSCIQLMREVKRCAHRSRGRLGARVDGRRAVSPCRPMTEGLNWVRCPPRRAGSPGPGWGVRWGWSA